MTVPRRMKDLAERFSWSGSILENELPVGHLLEQRRFLTKFMTDAETSLSEVRRLIEEIPRTTSIAGRTQIALDMVTPRKLIREEILGALRRSELTIVASANPGDVLAPVVDSEYEGAPAKMLAFTTHSILFSYENHFNPRHQLEKVLPYIEAVSRFDIEALLACLEFAERAFQADIDIAAAYKAELDSVLEPADWVAQAVLVNRGDRALVVHAHGVLITSGTERPIPALPMRISVALPAGAGLGDQETRPETTLAYLSVPPQTTMRLLLEAEGEDIGQMSAALEGVYDQGLLDCSLVLLRQGQTFPSRATLSSTSVRFGANLRKDQQHRIADLVTKKRR